MWQNGDTSLCWEARVFTIREKGAQSLNAFLVNLLVCESLAEKAVLNVGLKTGGIVSFVKPGSDGPYSLSVCV